MKHDHEDMAVDALGHDQMKVHEGSSVHQGTKQLAKKAEESRAPEKEATVEQPKPQKTALPGSLVNQLPLARRPGLGTFHHSTFHHH